MGGDGLCGEELLNVVTILPKLIVSMGEQEQRCFDDKVVCGGPLATHFNLCGGFQSPKLYLSRPNMSNTFVNTVDVMERTEDCINVNRLPFDKCIPLRAWQSCWGTQCTSDPSFDSGWVSLESLDDISGFITADVRT